MPRNLADKATFVCVFNTMALEAEILALAQTFGFAVVDDTIVVVNGDGTMGKKITLYAPRERRQEFAALVTNIAKTLGHKSGAPNVLVEVNGSAATYERGVDYEPPSVSKEP